MSDTVHRLVSIQALVEAWEVSERWIRDRARLGDLPCYRLEGMYRFDPDEANEWMRQHKIERRKP